MQQRKSLSRNLTEANLKLDESTSDVIAFSER